MDQYNTNDQVKKENNKHLGEVKMVSHKDGFASLGWIEVR